MVEKKEPEVGRHMPEAIGVFGQSGSGKTTCLCAMYKGPNYDIRKDNGLFRVSNGLSGTTKQFDMAFSELFHCNLIDSQGLGDPKVPIPVWVNAFNTLNKQGH